jgi:predicted SAM-dependent methyltransferase
LLGAIAGREMNRVNIGCGETPTIGWLNFDNSMSIRLASYPVLCNFLRKTKLINDAQWARIKFCQTNEIVWANAAKRVPLPDNSVVVLYSSHMLEHLDRVEAKRFLDEARRVLAPEGIIRLAVPDIKMLVQKYIDDGAADLFIESAYMCIPRPRSVTERLSILLVGTRHHQWMYDSRSLCKLLVESGFTDAKSVQVGHTQIPNSEPLDLYERKDESVYVEAKKA